jgi:hypothetical protein
MRFFEHYWLQRLMNSALVECLYGIQTGRFAQGLFECMRCLLYRVFASPKSPKASTGAALQTLDHWRESVLISDNMRK